MADLGSRLGRLLVLSLCLIAPLAAYDETVEGVICTSVRNEAPYIQEWLEFHLLVGATKFVIYDDRSTDGLKKAVAPYGSSVVLYDIRSPAVGVPQELLADTRPAFMKRKRWALKHCAKAHAPPDATTGWLAVLDVDEFIFPCARESRDYTLWDAFTSTLPEGADSASLKCLKFGFSDYDKPLSRGELIIQHNTRRAPYPDLEPATEAWARANLTGCEKGQAANSVGVCSNMRARKTMYSLGVAAAAEPGWHFPSAESYDCERLSALWSRSAGVCCNHYMLRTTHAEMVEKFKKTWRGDNAVLLARGEGDARKWYTTVQDTLIFQYLLDLKEALARRGLPVAGLSDAAAASTLVGTKDPEEWRCGACRFGQQVGC